MRQNNKQMLLLSMVINIQYETIPEHSQASAKM